jgi:hypothetical protein
MVPFSSAYVSFRGKFSFSIRFFRPAREILLTTPAVSTLIREEAITARRLQALLGRDVTAHAPTPELSLRTDRLSESAV